MAPDTPEREPEMQDTPPCQHPNDRPEAPEKVLPVFYDEKPDSHSEASRVKMHSFVGENAVDQALEILLHIRRQRGEIIQKLFLFRGNKKELFIFQEKLRKCDAKSLTDFFNAMYSRNLLSAIPC